MISKIKNNFSKYVPLIIVLTSYFLTIAFAAFSNNLAINNVGAQVRIQKDIRITNIAPNSSSGGAVSYWEEYNTNNITSGISLPNSNSTITYNVEVTNIGNMEAAISEITGLPSNLTYTISDYNLKDMLCDDSDPTMCKLGSVTTLEITIGYKENGYDQSNTDFLIEMDFDFTYMVDAVARIGDTFYDTLQEAINDVPTDETETTIVLLNNTSEIISIVAQKNIYLNLNGKTVSNDGNTNVISNYGTLKLSGGTITSNASTNGAINNEATGTMIFDGVRVIMTGGRQALYNNKGNATITGSSYLTSSATARAAVQNTSGGTLTITGGTIISTGTYGVNNAGTMTVGIKDGNIDNDHPVIQGIDNGITSSTSFTFYDGTVKSKTNPFNNVSKISEMETGFGIINGTEIIGGETFKTAHLGISKEVKFNANGGSVTETVRYIEEGNTVGTLPTPVRSGYEFDGWFTLQNGGREIDKNEVINDNITFFAHWTKTTDVARIGTVIYATLAEAIAAAPENSQTTIVLLKDTSEALKVLSAKNIVLDLGGNTITNSGNSPVFENSGTLSINNGSLRSSAEQSIINNTAGNLTINNSELIITSTKQAVYITGGSVEITGNSYLSSQTNGIPTGQTMERGTVQVISGSLTITGGTIVGARQQAVSNQGTLTIGTKDGSINASSPVLIGAVHGIKNDGTFNYYDGVIKGVKDAINGPITDQETNSTLVNGTETISGKTYNTVHLE